MKMSRLALIATALAVALAFTPLLDAGDGGVVSQAHAQGGPGSGGGPGGGAGAGAGAGASAGAWGGGNGIGAAVSAAATNPETRGLAKAMDVVDKTPASEQAEQSLSAAFQRLFGSNGEEEEEELIEEGDVSID